MLMTLTFNFPKCNRQNYQCISSPNIYKSCHRGGTMLHLTKKPLKHFSDFYSHENIEVSNPLTNITLISILEHEKIFTINLYKINMYF